MAKFSFNIPHRDSDGFLGFLEDQLEVDELLRVSPDDSIDLKTLRAVKRFLSGLIIYDGDKNELFRSWSMSDLENAFEQISLIAEGDEDEKKDLPNKKGRSAKRLSKKSKG